MMEKKAGLRIQILFPVVPRLAVHPGSLTLLISTLLSAIQGKKIISEVLVHSKSLYFQSHLVYK